MHGIGAMGNEKMLVFRLQDDLAEEGSVFIREIIAVFIKEFRVLPGCFLHMGF